MKEKPPNIFTTKKTKTCVEDKEHMNNTEITNKSHDNGFKKTEQDTYAKEIEHNDVIDSKKFHGKTKKYKYPNIYVLAQQEGNMKREHIYLQ